MEKEIKKDKINKEELSQFLQEDMKKGIGNIRNYVFNENNNLVEEYKTKSK